MNRSLLLALLVLVSGCDQLLSAGRSHDDDRVSKLESRIADLENQLKEKQSAADSHRLEMAACLDHAATVYWDYVKLNGRKRAKPADDGSDIWNAPVHVFDQASKLKQNAIEECRVLWGKE